MPEDCYFEAEKAFEQKDSKKTIEILKELESQDYALALKLNKIPLALLG